VGSVNKKARALVASALLKATCLVITIFLNYLVT